jgi:D-3-phosphoglycerate dehydrogenase
MRVLVTCPPMLGQIDTFRPIFEQKGIELLAPDVVQTLSEDTLEKILPTVDGWIIGDDPATERVFTAGAQGALRAAVKWGVGVDNVDFEACKKLDIPVTNTPHMFGREVANIALHFVIALARETFDIDREVRKGGWPKPAGISLAGRTVALIGFGDIGRAAAHRLHALEMKVVVYDPYAQPSPDETKLFSFAQFPDRLGEADFVVITASLNDQTHHMINAQTIGLMRDGVRIVNVSRGPVIKEADLIETLQSGKVYSAALDVFEEEPLPMDSPLRQIPRCIFGTHNGSNTVDAVKRASYEAIARLFEFLDVPYDAATDFQQV